MRCTTRGSECSYVVNSEANNCARRVLQTPLPIPERRINNLATVYRRVTHGYRELVVCTAKATLAASGESYFVVKELNEVVGSSQEHPTSCALGASPVWLMGRNMSVTWGGKGSPAGSNLGTRGLILLVVQQAGRRPMKALRREISFVAFYTNQWPLAADHYVLPQAPRRV